MHFFVNIIYISLQPDVSLGDLKTPSISIPKGTIVAVLYTFTIYILLFLLVSATCERSELIFKGLIYLFLSHQKKATIHIFSF